MSQITCSMPATLIDLGCGTGQDAARFLRRGTVIGYDIHPENIAVATSQFPQGDWRVADITSVDLSNFSDPVHVRCTEVLEHIPQWKKVIERMRDLPSGSLAFITVPHPAAEKKLLAAHKDYWKEIDHVHAIPSGEMIDALEQAGFTVSSSKRVNASLYFELRALFKRSAPCIRGTYYENTLSLWQRLMYSLLRTDCLHTRLKYLPIWLITIPLARVLLDPFFGATQQFMAKKR